MFLSRIISMLYLMVAQLRNCMTFYIIKKLILLFSFNISIFHYFIHIYMTIPLVITGTIKFSGKIILMNYSSF